MSDIGPYGVTQNADAAAVTANALVGEHAGNVTAHQADARFGPALFSTAPFKGGPEVDRGSTATRYDDHGHPLCFGKNNTCRSWRLSGSDYCRWHG